MQIHSSPDAHEGELPVNMNPGGGDHFGILYLGADMSVSVETDEDADRIVRAAMRIKAMRAALGKPHAHERGAGPHGSHCTVCGLLKDAAEHTAPAPGPFDAAIQQARVWAGHVTGGCMAVSDAGTGCTAAHTPHAEPHRDTNGYEWGDSRCDAEQRAEMSRP